MKDYKLKLGSYAPRIHWVGRGTGTPKDRDEVVYYESIKQELKIKSIYECRCDERLQSKTRKLRTSHTLGWPWNWNT
jgi:hypothetical protein